MRNVRKIVFLPDDEAESERKSMKKKKKEEENAREAIICSVSKKQSMQKREMGFAVIFLSL